MRLRTCAAAAAVFWLLFAHTGAQPLNLGAPRHLAAGVNLYHLADPSLLTPAGPVSVWALELDAAQVDIKAVLANDEIVDTETVADIARRHGAVAAINAGFFLQNGDPAGVLEINDELVSDTLRGRGAVGVVPASGRLDLIFGRLSAAVSLVIQRAGKAEVRVPIAGVDTTRARGRLMLYTPAYHSDTTTAASGTEWVVDGSPLTIRSRVRNQGSTPIPRTGYVLSFGGVTLPPALQALTRGTRVRIDVSYQPVDEMSAPWDRARDIVGGAGLLARDGVYLHEWASEQLATGFPETRHPRTLIGTTTNDTIWMIAVDGRQPQLSAGMTFSELQSLSKRIGLTNVLNLDGGGSTTMWVQGAIVNSPSDPAGPRKVSDALLVYSRPSR
jgi:hypothetical protein